ncbi:hypothetical protein DPMN_184388 [Dreissena polymorpha]|uniref:Uncharacterized protein n=1 Tax=Dreissena polymorpha TaxID=45954 RepID=A0A9D4I7B8_DREPO|nr:hypothetical protein DPMN_184388 [Dreissena polymorpha]
MITVRNDMLEKGRTLQQQHRCVDVTHHEDALFVTSEKAVYQYTLTGLVIQKLYEDTT